MNKCIHDLFETIVEQTPSSIATVFENQQLTYQQLNHSANQLAHYLQKCGVTSENLVGICLEPSLELVIGLLGIIKAGGIVVPLEPTLPKERLVFILKESKISILLVQQQFLKNFLEYISNHQMSIICLDKDWPIIKQQSTTSLSCELTIENLAFIIFTSGSTGKPKGVMIPHRAVVRNLHRVNVDRYLFQSSISFVGFIGELIRPLLVGATVIIAKPMGLLDNTYLVRLIVQQKITTISFVPTALQIFIDDPKVKNCNHLKTVFCSGEVLSLKLQERFFNTLPTTDLYYIYGQTETCGTVTLWHCRREEYNKKTIPIGNVADGVQVYILDNDMKPVPIGDIGELYVGSMGLARGYLNRPELTAEKFISDPFSNTPDSRLYKTGDLARYLPDGEIEFLGRIDHQINIRGYRIEPHEIETALGQHPAVQNTVVVAREDQPGNKRLVAYVIFNPMQDTKPSELRRFLKEKLPNYMIPSIFVILDALPLTLNGKVDRRALPIPKQVKQEPKETFVAPQSDLEQRITEIWEKVLRVHPIGIHDNFFDLGGHSLLAITLFDQIEKHFGKSLPVIKIFQAPTIAQIVEHWDEKDDAISLNALEIHQSEGFFSPFFWVGSTGFIHNLLPSLGKNQPVYGLNILNILSSNDTISIEEIAKRCIQEMQIIQPTGPYYLGGYCGDGESVAWEIGQQFYVKGQKATLFLIDSFFYMAMQGPYRLTYHWSNLLARGPNYLFQKIRKRGKLFFNFLIGIFLQKHLLSQLSQHSQSPSQYTKITDAYKNATANYTSKFPYPGKIIFFFASEWNIKDSPAFAHLTTEEVEIYEISGGTHSNLFVSPQVEVLGKQLKQCLEKSQAQGSDLSHS